MSLRYSRLASAPSGTSQSCRRAKREARVLKHLISAYFARGEKAAGLLCDLYIRSYPVIVVIVVVLVFTCFDINGNSTLRL